jgi:sulfhydrogenase subunit beta (sulfur reductase)
MLLTSMKAYTIEKNNLKILLDKFLKDFKVYGPTKSGLDSMFNEIKTISDLHLDYISTVLPPKKYFHPPKQTLFKFTIKDDKFLINESVNDEKFILFGVHPCDVHAILELDEFFSREFKDSYYQNRRKNAIIVALNCVEPSDYCFCNSMGTGPFLDKGYDILLTDIGTEYLLETGSEIGRQIIDGLKLKNASDITFNEKKRRLKLTEKKFKKFIDIKWLPRIAQENLDHEVWIKLGEHGGVAGSFPCLSCGSCTFVCPTCYCYDIYDKLDLSLKNGFRVRELDSCQLLEYGEVALNENFRRETKDRIRHWMLCKFGAAAGGKNSSCVGCGRCIRICPSKIDLTKVAKELRGWL